MEQSTSLTDFQTLVEIVASLRGPGGCPWDQEQTAQSLIQYAIEEAHELAEAIESGKQSEIIDELGDFLFQVILQSQVAEDEGRFSLSSVIQNLNQKMTRRHPHVFTDAKVSSISDVWKKWEQLKAEENKGKAPKAVFSYPKNLPALQAAGKIGGKTKRLKFDWEQPNQVLDKVKEELAELEAEMTSTPDLKKTEHEIGDLLFSTAQLARHLGLEPEQCLRKANRRFEERFNQVLQLSQVSLEKFPDLSNQEKENLWALAKKIEADRQPPQDN